MLLTIDAVGVDVFLLLVLIQLQMSLVFVRRARVEGLRSRLCGWGPVLSHWRTLTNAVVIVLLPFVPGLHYLLR